LEPPAPRRVHLMEELAPLLPADRDPVAQDLHGARQRTLRRQDESVLERYIIAHQAGHRPSVPYMSREPKASRVGQEIEGHEGAPRAQGAHEMYGRQRGREGTETLRDPERGQDVRVHGPENQWIRVSLPTKHLQILVRIVARQTDEPPCLREAVPLDEIPIGPLDDERQEDLILILVVVHEELQEKARNDHPTVPDRIGESANFESVGVPKVALVQQTAWMSDDGQRALSPEPLKELLQVPFPVRDRDERPAKPNSQHAGAAARACTPPRATQEK